jgi:hypothetical protein
MLYASRSLRLLYSADRGLDDDAAAHIRGPGTFHRLSMSVAAGAA